MSALALRIGLVAVCAAMCLVHGDAVAHGGGSGLRGITSSQSGAQASGSAQTRLLISDMSHRSERLPAGVPRSYDWALGPRTRPFGPLRGFRAFTAWGQLYPCAGAVRTPTSTVDFRNLQAWVLVRGSRRWHRIQSSSDLAGAAFSEDFAGPTVAGRYSASATGTSAQLVPGHNFHFWPDAGRVRLDAADVRAITVALEARLAPTPARAPAPCLVLSVGGDMWSSVTAQPGGSSSGDVGIGRFKRVEGRWRLYTMTTALARLMRREPLPTLAPAGEDF